MFSYRAVGATLLAVTTLSWAQNSTTIDLSGYPNNTLEATAYALIYALPLIQLVNQTSAVFRVVGGPNKINSQAALSSLGTAAVVKPNVDTIYDRAVLDLSQGDLEILVPNITDRFWIFPFYDAFGNNYANISPVNGSQPGLYLVRRAEDAATKPGLQIIEDGYYSKYKGVVSAPTTYGTLLIRYLLKYNTTANLDIVHGIQNKTSLTPVPRAIRQPYTNQAPAYTPALINESFTGSAPQQLLQLLSRIAPHNQPLVSSERFKIADILGQAGLVGGKYTLPSGVNITQAYAIANATIDKSITDPRTYQNLSNGWQQPLPPYAGNFGPNYAHRAYVARTGYQQIVPYIVQYPGLNGPAFGPYTLPANRSFLYTFSKKPPVINVTGGFWSLTYYGPDQYLIPNPINTYSLGDRSNLTYPDGTSIYGTGSDPTKDGPFKILVQQADIAPPKNWTTNWLPTPAGSGSGSFILRWYSPSLDFTNGNCIYPKVETIASIKG